MKPPDKLCVQEDDGFSLVEVLVALALSTFVVGVFQLMLVDLVRTLDAADEQARAVAYADSMLSALGSHHPLAEGITSGSYDGDVTYALEIAAENQARVGASGQLYRVTLDVSWTGVDGPRQIEFLTYRIGDAS